MSAEEFGLIVAGKKTSIPLRDVSINAAIIGYVLGLKSVLTYKNDSSDPVEVLFRFPLEDSHAVVGLTAVINGKKIKAEIREKEEARAAYDDAIASGQSAALGEEKSGDVFSISLGNLPPQKDAEIHLELVGELPIDAENKIRFSLPSTLKPRYTPSGSTDPLVPVTGVPNDQIEHSKVSGVTGFELRVLNASSQIANVTSPTHSLKTTEDSVNDQIVVSLAEEKCMDRDLIIQLEHKDVHQPTVLVESGKDGDGQFMNNHAVMLNFFPDFEQKEAACEFIFLIDRSGSMSGSYIKSARETLMLFMKSLPETSHFNIIGFGSRFTKLFKESVPYNQETLDTSMAHLQDLQADLGGTELLQPLQAIFSSPTVPGFSRQVFVLTDGSVSNTNQCIQKVKDYSSFSRCFTFGIGSGASTSLVEGLAKAGNGAAEFVKSGERMQPKVIRSLKRALQPSVTDVSVEFTVAGQQCKVLQSPEKLPPIYNDEKLAVYGVISAKLPLNGTAVLKGQIGDEKIEQKLSFEIQAISSENSFYPIHHLAAKALIKDWQSEKKDKSDIVKLSIEGSVISSHTAFIAVSEESSDTVSAAMKTYDLQAAVACEEDTIMSYQQQADCVKGVLQSNLDKLVSRGEKLEDLQCLSEDLQLNAASFNRSATRSKGGGGIGSFFSNLFGGRSKKASAPPVTSSALTQSSYSSASVDLDSDDSLCSSGGEFESKELMEDLMEDLMEEEGMMESAPRMSAQKESSCLPSMPVKKMSPAQSSPVQKNSPAPAPLTNTLTALVNAQQANGSWVLNATLAGHFGKSLKELEDSCPKDIPAVVWSTVLVLTLLRKRFSEQEEEWELIAMKTNSWLKKQSIPIPLTDLFKTAETVV